MATNSTAAQAKGIQPGQILPASTAHALRYIFAAFSTRITSKTVENKEMK